MANFFKNQIEKIIINPNHKIKDVDDYFFETKEMRISKQYKTLINFQLDYEATILSQSDYRAKTLKLNEVYILEDIFHRLNVYEKSIYEKYPPKYIPLYIKNKPVIQCGLCQAHLYYIYYREAFWKHWYIT